MIRSAKLGVVVICCHSEGCQWWRREIVLASVVSPVITDHDVFGAIDKHPVSASDLISHDESMGEVVTLLFRLLPDLQQVSPMVVNLEVRDLTFYTRST